jgi:hypothetical protein
LLCCAFISAWGTQWSMDSSRGTKTATYQILDIPNHFLSDTQNSVSQIRTVFSD